MSPFVTTANKYEGELTISTKHIVWLHHLVWDDEHKINFSEHFASASPFRQIFDGKSKKTLETHSWFGRPFESDKKSPTCFVSAQISRSHFKICELVIQECRQETFQEILPFLEVLISGIFLKYKIDFVRILNSDLFISVKPEYRDFQKTKILFPSKQGGVTEFHMNPILEIESSAWWSQSKAQDHRLQLSYLTKRDAEPEVKKEKSRMLIRLFSFNRRQ